MSTPTRSSPSRTSSSRSLRVPWSGLLVATLTAVLIWLFVRDLDAAALRHAFATAHLGLVALAVLTTLQTYFIRAWRWQTLLRPLGVVPFRSAFRMTVIGFTAIFLLPARVGEVLRPYLLARQESLNPSATFATVVLERVLDLIAVLLLFGLALPFIPVAVGPEVRIPGAIAGVVSLIGLALLFMFAAHPERLGVWVDWCCAWLPRRIAEALGRFARKFAEGLAVMGNARAVLTALAWSVALWSSICLGIWLVSRAFDLTVPFIGAFLVVMYLVVGVSAPTPGGAGGFHTMYKWAVMDNFGAPADAAAAAAILLHLVSFVPVALLGFVFMWQDGLTLAGLRNMAPARSESGTPSSDEVSPDSGEEKSS